MEKSALIERQVARVDRFSEHEDMDLSSLALQPGQNVTLSFSSVIALHPDEDSMTSPAMAVTLIVGGNYTLRTGEGYQAFNVTAVP